MRVGDTQELCNASRGKGREGWCVLSHSYRLPLCEPNASLENLMRKCWNRCPFRCWHPVGWLKCCKAGCCILFVIARSFTESWRVVLRAGDGADESVWSVSRSALWPLCNLCASALAFKEESLCMAVHVRTHARREEEYLCRYQGRKDEYGEPIAISSSPCASWYLSLPRVPLPLFSLPMCLSFHVVCFLLIL